MSDPAKLKVVKQVDRPDILFSIARVPESTQLYVGSSDQRVYSFDAFDEKSKPQAFVGHRSYVSGLVLTHSGQLVSGGYDGRLIWWNRESRDQVRVTGIARSQTADTTPFPLNVVLYRDFIRWQVPGDSRQGGAHCGMGNFQWKETKRT